MKPENKTIDWRERYNKKFNVASFTWNGDNTNGLKFAEAENKKMKRFIAKELDLALTERTEEIVKAIEDYVWLAPFSDKTKIRVEGLREVLSKYLKQEEKDE